MCNTNSCIRHFIYLIQLIIIVLPILLVHSIILTNVHSSMPVITRSKTRSGLQDAVCPAPPPLSTQTCSNTITSTLENNTTPILSDPLIDLPELSHPSTLSISSSDADSCSASSLDSDFENLEFQNFNFPSCPEHTTTFHLKSSQNSGMESDYQDNKPLIESNDSSSTNDEIIKMLTAISSCTDSVTSQQSKT